MVPTHPWHPMFADPFLKRDISTYDPGIRRLIAWLPLNPDNTVMLCWTLGGAPEGMNITHSVPIGLWACHVLSGVGSVMGDCNNPRPGKYVACP